MFFQSISGVSSCRSLSATPTDTKPSGGNAPFRGMGTRPGRPAKESRKAAEARKTAEARAAARVRWAAAAQPQPALVG